MQFGWLIDWFDIQHCTNSSVFDWGGFRPTRRPGGDGATVCGWSWPCCPRCQPCHSSHPVWLTLSSSSDWRSAWISERLPSSQDPHRSSKAQLCNLNWHQNGRGGRQQTSKSKSRFRHAVRLTLGQRIPKQSHQQSVVLSCECRVRLLERFYINTASAMSWCGGHQCRRHVDGDAADADTWSRRQSRVRAQSRSTPFVALMIIVNHYWGRSGGDLPELLHARPLLLLGMGRCVSIISECVKTLLAPHYDFKQGSRKVQKSYFATI